MMFTPQNQKILAQNWKILDSGLCLKSKKIRHLESIPESGKILNKILGFLKISTAYQHFNLRSRYQGKHPYIIYGGEIPSSILPP